MAGASFSDVETYGSVKELYSEEKRYQEHIQNSLSNFIRRAEDGEVEFDGKNWNIAAQLQLNESYAAITDGEHLPDSDIMKDVFAQFRPKLHYATMEATYFASTRGHKNGRVGGKYIDDLVKSTLLAMTSGINFDLYANGRGFRANVQAAVAGQASFIATSSMRLRAGMRLDWYDSTYANKRGTIKIALRSVDRLTKTVYIDPAFGTGAVPVGAAANDKLVVIGALDAGEPTDGRYLAGLGRITDNSLSFGGLSPSLYAAWQTINQNLGGGNITQEALQLQFDQMYQISGFYPNKVAFNTCQKRAYLANFINQRRFTNNSFDTGASSLTFDPIKMGKDEKNIKPQDVEWLEDKDCDTDTFFIWNDECLCIASDLTNEPAIADEDGTEFRKRIGYDSDQGFYRYWVNTVSAQRNGIGKIYGCAVPAGAL
jgi:hypothetical protein